MDDDWFNDALTDEPRLEETDEEECPICGDDIGLSCPCMN